MSSPPEIRFGPFTFEPQTGSLWRGPALLPLLPKDAAILHVLMQHAGHVVSKDTLLEAVWPETYVTETVLKNGITRLRRLLADDPKAPRYIETRPRRGYRFLEQVQHETAGHEGPAPPPDMPQPVPSSPVAPPLLVGCEPELALLHEYLAHALAGRRQVVLVTGEVGIGKTTLVDAFGAQVAAEGRVWLAHGQCVAYVGEGEPYRPVLEALDRLCRGPAREFVLTLLRQEAPLWLAQLPGVLPGPEAEALGQHVAGLMPARMQRELAVLLERLTAAVPLVVVLEDLHWSDAATLDLLAVLAQRRDPARLLVLGTYRPEDAQTPAHLLHQVVTRLARHAHCHTVPLTAWPEAAVAAYLAHRLAARPWPAAAVRLLQHRSGGNPLFVTTFVDYLSHQGGLDPAGLDTLGPPLPGLAQAIPPGLRQLIEARLAQLTPTEQQVVEAASVVGGEGSAAAIAAGVAEAVLPVEAWCEALARRGEVLEARGTTAWPDGTVATRYGFRHTLYQQVAYERIPAARRQQLHRRIGARLELAYGEQGAEVAVELARHWQEGGDVGRAVRYRGLAAQKANRRSAPREAIEHGTQGLALLPQLPATPERTWLELRLHLTLVPALLVVHGRASGEVARAYQRAQALWQALGLPPRPRLALLGLWREVYWIGPLAAPALSG